MAEPLTKRPWWATALFGGIGVGLGLAGALGLASAQEHNGPPRVATSGVTLPAGAISLDERLRSIETALTTLQTDMTEVKARLPKR